MAQTTPIRRHGNYVASVGTADHRNQIGKGICERNLKRRKYDYSRRAVIFTQFTIEITEVNEDYAKADIIEEYFSNLSIPPNKYIEYYAELWLSIGNESMFLLQS